MADFDTQDLASAAEKVSVVQAVAKDSLVLVEDPADLFLVHELRRRGVQIKAACLGHREKKLLTGVGQPIDAN